MSKRSSKLLKTPLSKSVTISLLSIGLSFVVLNILSGLIGNIAYNGVAPPWFQFIWNPTKSFISTNLISIVSILLLLSMIALVSMSFRMQRLSRALTATDSLTELDDSLLRLLTNLVSNHSAKSEDDLKKEIKKLLHELLRDATRTVLGDKSKGRAMILLPEKSALYLIVIADHRISETSINRTRFYIGADELKDLERGTVGIAYKEQHIRVAHMTQQGGRWECSDENYINFDQSRAYPPYTTLVNVPIFRPSRGGNVDCIGILVLDSTIDGAFDSHQTQTLLEAITRRIAAVLSIYIEIEQ